MVSKPEFDKLVKRLGSLAVRQALEARRKLLIKKPFSTRDLSPAVDQAYHLLFDQDLDPETLWKSYQGVSEPATVPQSPGAGDTPSSEKGVEDVRNKHQTLPR